MRQIVLMLALFTAIVSGSVAPTVLAQTTGGPVILMGIDAEDGGIGAHGPIANYVSVVNSLYNQASNGGTGILVIGANNSTTQSFWNEIARQTGRTVTYVNGATNVTNQSFTGFRMIAVVSHADETFGGLTLAEHNALTARQDDIAGFINAGGGLLGFSSFSTNPYGYLGGFGTFTVSTGLSYSNITPTPEGTAVGITDALDVCCWHNEFTSYPAFLRVLAFSGTGPNAAAIGGSNVIVAPVANADLSITKTDTPDPVSAGSNITYTITITNNGPDEATAVTLNDVIPANTTFVSITPPSGFTCPVTPAQGGTGTVTCTGATLANTTSAVFTLIVNVNQGATGIISNTATVTSLATDTNTNNNSDTETTSIAEEADLALSLVVSPDPVASGGTSTYQLTLTNHGNTTATNVVLTQSDFFRQRGRTRLTIESFSTPLGFTCQSNPTLQSPTPTAEFVCRGTLAAGQTAQFEIVKRQRTALPNGTIIYHEAEVTTDTVERNTQNNRATDTTTVGQQQNPR